MTYFGKFTKISSFNLSHIRWTSPLFILLYDTSIMKINAGAFGNAPFYKISQNIDKIHTIHVPCMKQSQNF